MISLSDTELKSICYIMQATILKKKYISDADYKNAVIERDKEKYFIKKICNDEGYFKIDFYNSYYELEKAFSSKLFDIGIKFNRESTKSDLENQLLFISRELKLNKIL